MNDISMVDINTAARGLIAEQLKAVGIDAKDPYKVLKDGLQAETVRYDRDGDEVGREPNHKERRECATVILTMMGHLKAKTDEVSTKVEIQVRPGDVEKLEAIARELDRLSNRLGVEAWQRGEVIEASIAPVVEV